MLWFILIVAGVIGVVCICARGNEGKVEEYSETYRTVSQNSSRPSSVAPVVSTSVGRSYVDNMEYLHVETCIARFCGAIEAIRGMNGNRNQFQYAWYEIKKLDSGYYQAVGYYRHDSDYNLQRALQDGGYLEYKGMEHVEDGVVYTVRELRADNIMSNEQVVRVFLERFGSRISITQSDMQNDRVYVRFEFMER